MGHKLSILPRLHDKTGWHTSRQFNVGEVQGIKVDEAGMGKSLNSIPSPFARMHLFETAFEMVHHDLVKGTKLAGETYNRLVSDCLDVFELLFNWESHIKENKPLELDTWMRETELKKLDGSGNKKHKFLGDTLNTFLHAEDAFQGFEKCLLIKYNKKVIAGSSPFTGLFTAPDDLTNLGLLKPLSQIAYFSISIPFHLRKAEVRKYIFDFFETNKTVRDSVYVKAIRDYLAWYNDNGQIDHSVQIKYEPINSGTAQATLLNVPIKAAKSIGTQYFEPCIVRLNYRLNEKHFHLPQTSNDQRTFDYLLPLTASFYASFEPSKISEIVSIHEEDNDSVKVTISIDNTEVSKKYQKSKVHDQDGKIIDLYNDHLINFNLGIFPFIRINDKIGGIDFNNSFRVMMICQDLYYKYSNKDFELHFGKGESILKTGGVYHINRTDRTILEKGKQAAGSVFYSLDTPFDFIQVQLPPLEGGQPVRNTIALHWQEKTLGNKQVDFSIDFGTTSTFIAYSDDHLKGSDPMPFELTEKELCVAFLNKPQKKEDGLRWIDCYEGALTQFLYSSSLQIQEFIPSVIRKDEKYAFPIRSVLFQKRPIAGGKKEALSNANISFVYQKKEAATLALEQQQFIPNLKWNIKTNEDFADAVKAFIEELFMLIRAKILLNDGDPRLSKIYWFAPLSFTSYAKKDYTDLWKKYAIKYLHSAEGNVINLTESEAPFYHLFKNSTINNPQTVLTLDIGGGSTDIMLFNNAKPVIGTSVHFGANVLWGNGHNEATAAKTNGIFLAIEQEISKKFHSTELQELNEGYCTNDRLKMGSDEIINFWIANNEISGVIDRLNMPDFRLSYLLHLSGLIYHSLKLMQANRQVAPTCVVFSGNGSKYVDLIHDSDYIAKIWGYFIRKIFGGNHTNPQVILPRANRKEATCFGGLCMPSQKQEFSIANYLGFEKTGEKYTKYKQVIDNKELIFQKLLASFHEFVELFFSMNDTTELNFRNHFGIEIKPEPIKKFLIGKAEENLNEGYLKRLKGVDPNETISDSLFFYPLVGLIYKLNKLVPADLREAPSDKMVIYAGTPDSENIFLLSRITPVRRPDSIYTITAEEDNADGGMVSIIDDPEVHRMALGVYQGALNPVCSYAEFPQAGQAIKVISPGKARKEADKWVLEEKIQIEFN